MKRYKILPLFLGTIVFFTGCAKAAGWDAGKDTENKTDSTDISDMALSSATEENTLGAYVPRQAEDSVITYTYETMEIPSDDGENVDLYVDYTKPVIHLKNDDAASKIQSVFDGIQADNEAEADRMLKDLKEQKEELGDDFFVSYTLGQYFEETRNDGHLLSLCSAYYTDVGGAHGYTLYEGLNFDLETGEKLTMDSITEDKELFFTSVHDYIKELLLTPHYEERLFDSVEEAMDTVDTSVIQDGFWYFTDCGITFIANAYELGPYAAGDLSFEVPFEKIKGLKPKYTYSGAYMYPALIGTEVVRDLNGDGMEDTLLYESAETDDYSAAELSLFINNIDFTAALKEDDIFLDYGSVADIAGEYYLIDLDESDSFTEIALKNRGDNDCLATYFFRFNGEEVSYLGFISDFPENTTCKFPGDGTITADTALNLLETRKISVQYRMLDSGSLEIVPEDWYYPKYDNQEANYSSHAILKDVTVHKEKSLDSDAVTLTPEDGPVEFPATDNENWFVVETSGGEIYYLYLSDFSATEDGEEAYDVFENLYLVG